jgi:hypothetical protein
VWAGWFVGCLLPLLAGCSNQRAAPSGFLGNDAELKTTGRGDDRAYVRQDVDWAAYHHVLIDPPCIRPARPGAVHLGEDDQAHLCSYLEKSLADSFDDCFTVVSEPVPGTLRIRSAITEVGKANPLINIPATVLAWPIDYGGVAVEMEITDAATGQRLCALEASRTADPLQFLASFTWLGHARHGLDACADRLCLTIESADKPPASQPTAQAD